MTSSGSSSNRKEEHLAVALYNASRAGAAFALPDERPLSVIDYQTPLKARQSDQGVGKIDLFGVVDGCVPCVIELKVKGTDIRSEVAEQHGMELTESRPALVVMAPTDYWSGHPRHPKAGEWISAISHLTAGIADTKHLEVHLLALLDAGFEMGLAGKRARLTGDCRVVSIDALMAGPGETDPLRVR